MVKTLKPIIREVQREDYLEGALKTAEWLDSLIVTTPEGAYWQKKTEAPEMNLYSGSAGIILFYIQLAQVTGEQKYLDTAKAAGRYLVHYIQQTDLTAYFPGIGGLAIDNANWVFITGHTGIAFSLIELAKATGEASYQEAVLAITEALIDALTANEHGKTWTQQAGIVGDGAIVLYLIYAAKYFQKKEWLDSVKEVGEYILSTKVELDEKRWKFNAFNPAVVSGEFSVKASADVELPNFECGTAGVGYIFTELYQLTQDERYLNAAVKAANYIESIAVPIKEDGILIPYRFPDMGDIFYLGWCHGPVGTARLFENLYQITNEASYRDTVYTLAQGIINAEAPNVHSEGYWHFYGICCGTAGFVEFFLSLAQEDATGKFMSYAKESADKLLSEATVTQEGARWYHAWTRIQPDNYNDELGYFDGAAGIATSLLHIYTALDGQYDKIYFPDEPAFRSRS